MAKKNKPNQRVFAVFGLGIFGRKICETLTSRGAQVIAVDNQPELVERVKETVMQAFLLNSTDEESLAQLPLEDVDEAVVAMGDSVEASILTTALLKKFALPRVIARAVSTVHEQVLRQVGADEVLNLEEDAGVRLASRLVAPQVLERISISRDISVAELYTPQSITGVALAELSLRRNYEINIIAIKRITQEVDETGNPLRQEQVLFPTPTETLQETDVIHIVGRNDAIDRFRQL
ncbi:trk system potassium uptake protein TrkA [Alkalispirochaeta americana]|uniref:Trk system potassium uptake protein TrkA n=1 Tax=Alkalispirochaeta americana TaxID=159291 RepID=A0A1N6WCP7_9SPIO|nr:TrkA family potassium uptake protein [Alkalispirochaeta americana]SIQ87864.1 trk system potassium uptake protein TrkA [Alkalispirochaeta americana]